MKKTKTKEPVKPTKGALYLNEGMTLAQVIKQLMDLGVTDLSKVRYDHDYVGCCGGHSEGEYCYCPSSYTDIRFDWEA